MALISGHCLNSVFGTNAAGLRLRLLKAGDAPGASPVFEATTSPDGRFKETVAPATVDTEAVYEIIYDTGAQLAADPVAKLGGTILPESVVRFRMPDPGAHYHFSMAFTPGSFTMLAVVLKA